MKYLLLLLLMSSCAHFKGQPEVSETAKETPEWIYSPYDACSESEELCATGEGQGMGVADAQAKASLASIFEVKIESQLNVTSSSSQTNPWQTQASQEVQQSLKESVNQVLETVQIKKRFRKSGLTYSLASLDRRMAGDLIGQRLSKIDQELSVLWKIKQRTNLRKIYTLFLEREKLNERFSIVTGIGRPSPVSKEELVAWQKTRTSNAPLFIKVGQAPEWMTEKIKSLLTEAGFKLQKGAPKVLVVNVDSIKEFLNVEGFEKYTFTLNMMSIENGQKNKVISVSETVTGRSQADALLKVKTFFTDYIEQHLSELHLD